MIIGGVNYCTVGIVIDPQKCIFFKRDCGVGIVEVCEFEVECVQFQLVSVDLSEPEFKCVSCTSFQSAVDCDSLCGCRTYRYCIRLEWSPWVWLFVRRCNLYPKALVKLPLFRVLIFLLLNIKAHVCYLRNLIIFNVDSRLNHHHLLCSCTWS